MTQTSAKRSFGRVPLVALGLLAASARAEDLTWSGFMTVGSSFSDRSEPYGTRAVSKEPDFVGESVLGLNLGKQLTPDLKAAAQLVAQEKDADSAVKADWAFLSYHPVNSLEVIVGKQKLPMWLVSSYLDVGVAYPWSHPPEEVYSLFNLKSFTGAAIYYDLKLGSSSLSIGPYGGESLLESAPNAPTISSKITGKHLIGGVAEWTWDKTTVRAAYNQATWNLNLGPDLQFGERRFQIFSYGVSSKYKGITLMAEYASTMDLDQDKYQQQANDDAAAAGAAAKAGDSATAAKLGGQAALLKYRVGGAKAYYVTGGYQLSPVGVYLTYADLQKPVLPPLSSDQRSVALDIAYDTTPDSVIKVEAKKISIPDQSSGLFMVAPGASRSGLNGAMIYSANFNVVF